MAKQNKLKPEEKTGDEPASLENIDIQINEFGQIVKNFDIDKINTYLNENVPDKKLTEEK
jgi:hypothetical protein